MLGINQIDFLNYSTAFKGNYRKGIHKLEAILSTKAHAEEFAQNKGGVSVIFGVPLDAPDKNSDTLLALLLGSDVVDLAVETFLSCFYEFSSLDELLKVNATCQAIFKNPVQLRAVGGSPIAAGKLVATLAGLNCASYANIDAVAASSSAMKAVAASSTAMAAVIASPTALNAVVSSSTAMAAVAASKTALSACRASSTAMGKLAASSTALSALAASSFVTKYNPSNGNAWTTGTVNGGGIFIKVISYQPSGNTVAIDGGGATSISDNTNYAKAFQSKLSVYYVPYSVSGYGIYYIPC